MLAEIFQEDKAKIISNIPLSPLQPKDRMIWRCTTNGQFSVRSAYHLEMERLTLQHEETSHLKGQSIFWRTIWQLNVANVVKMFLWKAYNNLLLTKANLFRRKVVKESNCPICYGEPELVLHALWLCPSAQYVWGCDPVKLQKTSTIGTDFSAIWTVMQERCNEEEIALVATLSRNIWLRRNVVIHEGGFKHHSTMQ